MFICSIENIFSLSIYDFVTITEFNKKCIRIHLAPQTENKKDKLVQLISQASVFEVYRGLIKNKKKFVFDPKTYKKVYEADLKKANEALRDKAEEAKENLIEASKKLKELIKKRETLEKQKKAKINRKV